MNIPVLNPVSATVGVLFAPIPVPQDQLTQIYSRIVRDHPAYGSFNLLPQGGAHVTRADGSYVHIERDKVQVFDNIVDVSFTHAKERILGIFKAIFPPLAPAAINVAGVKLVALADAKKSGGAVGVINGTFNSALQPEKIEYHLGPRLTGVGLRFSLKKDEPWPSVCELRVEPFYRDLDKLYVELDVQFPTPVPGIAGLEKQVDHVAVYFKGGVKDFLAAL